MTGRAIETRGAPAAHHMTTPLQREWNQEAIARRARLGLASKGGEPAPIPQLASRPTQVAEKALRPRQSGAVQIVRHVRRDFLIIDPAGKTPSKPDLALRPRMNAYDIIRVVAKKHGIRSRDIIGPAQTSDVVLARQEAMWACRTYNPHMSFPKLGRIFGRDHSTVMLGVRKHKERNGL